MWETSCKSCQELRVIWYSSMTTCKYFFDLQNFIAKKTDKKDVQCSENEQIFVINWLTIPQFDPICRRDRNIYFTIKSQIVLIQIVVISNIFDVFGVCIYFFRVISVWLVWCFFSLDWLIPFFPFIPSVFPGFGATVYIYCTHFHLALWLKWNSIYFWYAIAWLLFLSANHI